MEKSTESFGKTASNLSRNPLGIIALFIVLVYGFASLVTVFIGSLSSMEKLPLIYFLILFPVLVLGAFVWLVSEHSDKLYGPSDYKNEENFMRMQLKAGINLTAATMNSVDKSPEDYEIDKIADTISDIVFSSRKSTDNSKKRILWVDDRPENNVFVRNAFEAIGVKFSIALSTDEAMGLLDEKDYAAIISDMGRKEGDREGYVLLEKIRKMGNKTPFFIFAGSNLPEHRREALERGAQGSTNDARELFTAVSNVIVKSI